MPERPFHSSANRSSTHERHDQVPARRGADSEDLVQHPGRPSEAGTRGVAPGHTPADRTQRPGTAVSDGVDHAGGVDRARDRHPGAGAPGLSPVAAVTLVPGAPAPGGAEDAGEDLLQV